MREQQCIPQPIQQIFVTSHVMNTIPYERILEAIMKITLQMREPNPESQNLWQVFVGTKRLWGILDEGIGPHHERRLTILYPEDY